MFWFGVAVGSALTFVFVLIVLAFTRTTRDDKWMESEREFRRDLLDQWNQANIDNAERNRALWAIQKRT